jgi:hypothetical protein
MLFHPVRSLLKGLLMVSHFLDVEMVLC